MTAKDNKMKEEGIRLICCGWLYSWTGSTLKVISCIESSLSYRRSELNIACVNDIYLSQRSITDNILYILIFILSLQTVGSYAH